MERRFIETNYRTLEVDQAFSVMQIAPAAAIALRETGECTFTIPELAFDLYYPGHYRIRSIRLTISLRDWTLYERCRHAHHDGSFIRSNPRLGADALCAVPLSHTTSIATSSARNDAGVFDFNFRDERYMPFEGAGAVNSSRTITLPRSFPPFDYRTIADAVIHVHYTSLADGLFRQSVEATSAALDGSIQKVLSQTPVARAISLRSDFFSSFQRLITAPAGGEVEFEIDQRFLPFFLQGKPIRVKQALLLVRTAAARRRPASRCGSTASCATRSRRAASFPVTPHRVCSRHSRVGSSRATGWRSRRRGTWLRSPRARTPRSAIPRSCAISCSTSR